MIVSDSVTSVGSGIAVRRKGANRRILALSRTAPAPEAGCSSHRLMPALSIALAFSVNNGTGNYLRRFGGVWGQEVGVRDG
jgi:hypothetical protein